MTNVELGDEIFSYFRDIRPEFVNKVKPRILSLKCTVDPALNR